MPLPELLKRAFQAVMNGVSYLANVWWSGVVYMTAGIDPTKPLEVNRGRN
jgi:hypothetical protein